MFNRRLQASEVGLWLKLYERSTGSSPPDMQAAEKYLRARSAVTFVTTTDGSFLGGTCINKDPTRLGMVLAAVAIPPEHREQFAFSLVKSSLPFFRTVAIRDVDALVAADDNCSSYFPYSTELQSWTEDVLKNAGFAEECEIVHTTVKMASGQSLEAPIGLDRVPRFEKAKELIWNEGRKIGLANSATWTALSFAHELGCLHTSSGEKDVTFLMCVHELPTALIINPVVYDGSAVSAEQVAQSILAYASKKGKSLIELPMMGEGQTDLLRSLQQISGTSLSTRRLKLMRKML